MSLRKSCVIKIQHHGNLVSLHEGSCALACKHPIEDQVLYLVGNQLVCHGGEVQFAEVDIAKETLPLLAGFRRDVIGMALILALERGGILRNVNVDPLPVVIKEDSESWF